MNFLDFFTAIKCLGPLHPAMRDLPYFYISKLLKSLPFYVSDV